MEPHLSYDQLSIGLTRLLGAFGPPRLEQKSIPVRRVVSPIGYLPALLVQADLLHAEITGKALQLTLQAEGRAILGATPIGPIPMPLAALMVYSAAIFRQNYNAESERLTLDPIIQTFREVLPLYPLAPAPSVQPAHRAPGLTR